MNALWVAAVLCLEKFDRLTGLAQALVGGSQVAPLALPGRGGRWRVLPRLPAQRLEQGGVIEQSGCQPQHRLPCRGLTGFLRQPQPVFQCQFRLAVPFRHAGQALPPRRVLGPLAHGGVSHTQCIRQIAVGQKSLIGQGVGFVVEGQQAVAGCGSRFNECCA